MLVLILLDKYLERRSLTPNRQSLEITVLGFANSFCQGELLEKVLLIVMLEVQKLIREECW